MRRSIFDEMFEIQFFGELKEMQKSNPLEFQRKMENSNFGNAIYARRDFLYQIKKVLEELDVGEVERKYLRRLQYLLKALNEPRPIIPIEIKEAIDSLPRHNIFFIIDKLKENKKYKDWINNNPKDFINACLYGCYSSKEDKDKDSLFYVIYKRKNIQSSKIYPFLRNLDSESVLVKKNGSLSFRPINEIREGILKVIEYSFTLSELQDNGYYENEDYIVYPVGESIDKVLNSLYIPPIESVEYDNMESNYLGLIKSDIYKFHIDTPYKEIKVIDRCCFEDVMNNISDFTLTNLSSQIGREEAFQYSSRFFKYLLDNNVYTKDLEEYLEDIED